MDGIELNPMHQLNKSENLPREVETATPDARRSWAAPCLQRLGAEMGTLKPLGCGESIDGSIKTSTCS